MPSTKVNPPVDPRHQERSSRFQQLFSWSFTQERQHTAHEQAPAFVQAILDNLEQLDSTIQVVAPERPLSEINKVDLTILRLMLWEARTSDVPKKVLVNEGIELAKAYGTQNSSKFVNATLARLLLEDFKPSQIA